MARETVKLLKEKMNKFFTIITAILILCGMVLSILSLTDLCNFGGCTDAHQYRFFGFSIPLLGIIYFGLMIILFILSLRFSMANFILILLIAGGAGGELTMLHLQKDVIQAWCPLCVGIAIAVYLLLIIKTFEFLLLRRRSPSMKEQNFIPKFLMIILAIITGFIVSFSGISKPEAATQSNFTLGKQTSNLEIYVFSDWICPICFKAEPSIEAAYRQLENRAKFIFVDKVIHPEAMNFVPYHLSFLIHEKQKYMPLRKALLDLARKNANPTEEQVQAAIAPLKVHYRQLSFMEVTQIMNQFQAFAAEFQVTATPTMVILNRTNGKARKLVGSAELTPENIMRNVNAVE